MQVQRTVAKTSCNAIQYVRTCSNVLYVPIRMYAIKDASMIIKRSTAPLAVLTAGDRRVITLVYINPFTVIYVGSKVLVL